MTIIITKSFKKDFTKILKLKYQKNLEDIEKGNFEKYDENGEKIIYN